MKTEFKVSIFAWVAFFSINSANAMTLTEIPSTNLTTGCSITRIPERELTIYSILGLEANLGFKMDIFDANSYISPHFHDIQTQFILILEGQGEFNHGAGKATLKAGEFVTIPPGAVHDITPTGDLRFVALDLPGFEFPEDTDFDTSHFDHAANQFPPFVAKRGNSEVQFDLVTLLQTAVTQGVSLAQPPVQNGKTPTRTGNNWIFPLSENPDHLWNISILDLSGTFEPATSAMSEGSEHFLVLKGQLSVKGHGETIHQLNPGQSVHFQAGSSYMLETPEPTGARVVRFRLNSIQK